MPGSKSVPVSWGGDRKGSQVVNLPMLAGGVDRKGCQAVDIPMFAEDGI